MTMRTTLRLLITVIILITMHINTFADSHSTRTPSRASTAAGPACGALYFGISLHDNDFLKDMALVSEIKTIAELKAFIARHKAEVLIDMQMLDSPTSDSVTLDSAAYGAELAEFRTQYIETHLRLWIEMENSRPGQPYIRGGSDKLNATTLEQLANGYISAEAKGGTLLHQAVNTILNLNILIGMIENGQIEYPLDQTKGMVADWAVQFRVRHLLERFKQTLIAVETPMAPTIPLPAPAPAIP